jgi:hypothetical protein
MESSGSDSTFDEEETQGEFDEAIIIVIIVISISGNLPEMMITLITMIMMRVFVTRSTIITYG